MSGLETHSITGSPGYYGSYGPIRSRGLLGTRKTRYLRSVLDTQTLSARRALHLLISRQWENYGKYRTRSWILRTKKNLKPIKRKTDMYTFVFPTHVIFPRLSTGKSAGKKHHLTSIDLEYECITIYIII